jgi:hypothetical protein
MLILLLSGFPNQDGRGLMSATFGKFFHVDEKIVLTTEARESNDQPK